MANQAEASRIIRFGVFELDLRAGELRKQGLKLKLQDQPFQILALLLERCGEVVTREEIQNRLWPDGTLVDFDQSVGTAIKKLRQALGDDAETPRYIETLPRRGYRFVAPVDGTQLGPPPTQRQWLPIAAAILGLALLGIVAFLIYKRPHPAPPPAQRTLTRLTFDSGLQFGATWSPDGRFIAYSSDRGGKFDIWVQRDGSTNPARVTSRSGHNWQPDWSPDGNWIAFRGEGEGGGLFVVPAPGGPERRITPFGYYPRWSPDGRQILFQTTFMAQMWNKLYVVGMDGSPPREVLADWQADLHGTRSVAWHPDGRRISVWGITSQDQTFWTVPLDGGTALKSDVAPQMVKQLKEISFLGGQDFRWAPSGRALYFEGSSRSVRNLWRVTVDPANLSWTSLERLTNGPGPDTDMALSHDGKKLAFTARVERVRVWSFAFDARVGRILGEGQPVTPPGVNAWMPELSRDGKKLVFNVERSGKWELWEESLLDGRATLLVNDGYVRWDPHWSPDGKRLAYSLYRPGHNSLCRLLPEGGGHEEALMSGEMSSGLSLSDWSPDGQWILDERWANQQELGGPGPVMWLLPLSAAPHAETGARLVTSGGKERFWEAKFSPDGQWIAFEITSNGPSDNARLAVVRASGGPWIPITDGKSWDDKPRWSPDGKTLFFLSSRTGLFNVWGVRLDAGKRSPLGEPFRVTAFESPGRMISGDMTWGSMSLAEHRLVVSMAEGSGNVWILEGLDQ